MWCSFYFYINMNMYEMNLATVRPAASWAAGQDIFINIVWSLGMCSGGFMQIWAVCQWGVLCREKTRRPAVAQGIPNNVYRRKNLTLKCTEAYVNDFYMC